jgi:excisionase family DNA binding protein
MKEFLTVIELGEYLNIKPKTLYSWAAKRIIPGYQIQGIIRLKKNEIEAWLETCQLEAVNTTEHKANMILGHSPLYGKMSPTEKGKPSLKSNSHKGV